MLSNALSSFSGDNVVNYSATCLICFSNRPQCCAILRIKPPHLNYISITKSGPSVGSANADRVGDRPRYADRVGDVLRRSDIFEIALRVVILVTIFMVDFQSVWSRANERGRYEAMNTKRLFGVVPVKIDAEITLPDSRNEYPASNSAYTSKVSSDFAAARHRVVPLVPKNRLPSFCMIGLRHADLLQGSCVQGRAVNQHRSDPLYFYQTNYEPSIQIFGTGVMA